LQDGTIQTSDVELKDTFLADVKENVLHIDGDMSRYLIDKEHKSCLRTKHPILKQSKTNGESVMVLFLSQQ
jgi:hypothetical protein